MYRIYRNDDGQLARLVYQVSGNSSLEFEDFVDVVRHVEGLICGNNTKQYVILDETTKRIVYFTDNEPNQRILVL